MLGRDQALKLRRIDTALVPLAPLLKEPSSWPGREPFVAALNGVLGDHLAASSNPLAVAMVASLMVPFPTVGA